MDNNQMSNNSMINFIVRYVGPVLDGLPTMKKTSRLVALIVIFNAIAALTSNELISTEFSIATFVSVVTAFAAKFLGVYIDVYHNVEPKPLNAISPSYSSLTRQQRAMRRWIGR